MVRKIISAVLCAVMVLGTVSLACAKDSIIDKVTADKSSIKEKLALSFSVGTTVMGGAAGARVWLTNSMGLDMQAQMALVASVFSMGVGANMVFPMMEEENVSVYMTPGFAVDFTSSGNVGFDFVAAVEAEAFLVKDLISVAGSLGLKLGIDVNSVATNFVMELGTDTTSLMFRIYI